MDNFSTKTTHYIAGTIYNQKTLTMKRIYNLLILCIGLFFTTCKKEDHSFPTNTDPFIKEAKTYFMSVVDTLPSPSSDHARAAAARTVSWNQATVVDLSMGKAVIVPVRYEKELFIRTTQGGANNFKLSNLTRLLIYQSHGVFHAEVVTSFPDTNYLRHPRGAFSGMVYVEDWIGNSLATYLYESGGIIHKYAPTAPSSLEALQMVTIQVCYQITGYNYSTASPSAGYAWSETPVCRPSMMPVDDDPIAIDYGNVAGGGGSGGGGAGTGIAGDFSIAIGHNLITNINDYFKCFSNSPSCTYQVMVCVDQPVPGSRTPWSFSASDGSIEDKDNPVSVGHTFLVFTEVTGGNVITRNVGFYPGRTVTPFASNTPGALNDDEMHPYNISGSFSVSGSLFFNMLTYITQNGASTYDLNTNNCTNFSINTLAAGHIYLPSTYGYWLNGMGVDPGDLGEDIRATNFVGMTRSTEQGVHMNVGTCN